jgi:CDP-glucose 4,6-dehydratase
MSFESTFRGKTVLVTGHTGFKGSWLTAWLIRLGANVVGASIDVPSNPSGFEVSAMASLIEDHRLDVSDIDTVYDLVKNIQPDYVFHLAAQSLVRPSYDNPIKTMTTNAIGSACILDALRRLNRPVVALMVTSDKAYDNVEWLWGYRETDQIGGKDPYSASKGMAELVIKTYFESYFNNDGSNVKIGIARAGNVIGGGDWATDRIVADCMRAWSNDQVVDIRSPDSTRPWQHVLEPLSGYLHLAQSLTDKNDVHGEAFNFGPPGNQDYSVRELITEMSKYWNNVRWNNISDATGKLHEANLLKLNCDKALHSLNWLPTLNFQETVKMTVDWYRTYYNDPKTSMFDFTCHQIEEYSQIAVSFSNQWAVE